MTFQHSQHGLLMAPALLLDRLMFLPQASLQGRHRGGGGQAPFPLLQDRDPGTSVLQGQLPLLCYYQPGGVLVPEANDPCTDSAHS